MEPSKLTESELNLVLKRVSPTGVDYQAGRICRYLAKNPNARTGTLASLCSVGNIADVVAKSINSKVEPLGLFVGCTKPPERLTNQFGQRAGDHYWSFYREAANDDGYQDGLAKELQELKKQHPEIAGISSQEEWLESLDEIFASMGIKL